MVYMREEHYPCYCRVCHWMWYTKEPEYDVQCQCGSFDTSRIFPAEPQRTACPKCEVGMKNLIKNKIKMCVCVQCSYVEFENVVQ